MNCASMDSFSKTEKILPEIFRVDEVPGIFIRAASIKDDEQLVTLIAESMPSNGILLSFERRPSYFAATYAQYETPQVMVMVEDHAPDTVIAMFNLGSRDCFINGAVEPLRYVGDLRIGKNVRGKGVSNLLMSYVKAYFPAEQTYQTVILSDNILARKILHKNRPGVPAYYIADHVETHTLTGFKSKKEIHKNLSIHVMTRQDINGVNRFIKHMADYYNFMPAYDFNGLLAQNPYWKGLSFNDFFIFRRGGQIVGLFGLWDQSSFKQTKITEYSKLIEYARPFYNYWAKFSGQLHLPKKGDTLNYVMLHSLLCVPYDVDLFESMLRFAHQQAIQRKYQAVCFTLAQNDPRQDCASQFISQRIRAMHSFHRFEGNPLKEFDAKRISYLECGRI